MNLQLSDSDSLSLLNILYVDSDEKQAKQSVENLKTLFSNIDVCNGAIEALSAYTTKLYDIVITEIELEVMDGFTLSREIRQINPNQNIIIITSDDSAENLKQFLSSGLDGFLLKPIDIQKEMNTFTKIVNSLNDAKELDEYRRSCKKNTTESGSALKSILKSGDEVNLVVLNVDSFKNINDSFGIEYGDKVLEYIYEKVNEFNIHGMDIYRMESDEFVLLDFDEYDEQKYTQLADLITSYFNESPIEVYDELFINISITIGIAHGIGLNVLNHARLAIKELREHTRGTYIIYDMNSVFVKDSNDMIYWTNRIQASVADDNVIAFFQPIFNNKTKKIDKYESLARIYDDESYVSPFRFMQAAKNTHVLPLITKSMIKQSCRMFKGTDYEFSINVTNDDLFLNYLEEYLLRNANLFDIEPSRITIELLEDIPSLDQELIIKQLLSLKDKGFKIAIDDFGSANSNFSRLMEFKPDYLKIDGSFIKNILTDEISQKVSEGIIAIAHDLGIEVIAEYIHSKEVQEKIEELGVDYSQGYLFGEPQREL